MRPVNPTPTGRVFSLALMFLWLPIAPYLLPSAANPTFARRSYQAPFVLSKFQGSPSISRPYQKRNGIRWVMIELHI